MLPTLRHTRPATALVGLALLAGAARAAETVEFNRDVRPILSGACFRCHGPAARRAGLRLDVRHEAVKPARSGAVPVVAGRPEQSELVRRIFSPDEADVMPPPAAHVTLRPAQKEVLKRWIGQGARYQKHWSFEPPVKADPPRVDGARGNNPVDAFIAARLRGGGLTLSPEADRPTLARRAAFALTGLPPTPAEVDAFVADPSPGAYERLVDRYLASPHYGEEMARH